MKKKVLALIFVLVFSTMFVGCGDNSQSQSGGGEEQNNNAVSSIDLSYLKKEADMFTDRDYEVGYDENEAINITLNKTSASCESNKVKIDGTKVTILDEGTYIISGSLDDGTIIVDAEETDKPQLVFDKVSVNSETSAPLYIIESDKVFVTLKEGTTNTLSNGGSFVAIDDNNIDAAVFSKQDIVFNGSGTLEVTSPAGHGIVSKDDLKITGGTIEVASASHGIDANDSVRIANGNVTIDAGKDAIHAENSEDITLGYVYIIGGNFNLEAEGDGISAGSNMQIEDGSFDITTGGGSSNATKEISDSFGAFMGGHPGGNRGGNPMDKPFGGNNNVTNVTTDTDDGTSIKGIKSASSMYIDKASFVIDAADDAIHSNSSMVINGGKYDITTGDDGFHADETIAVIDGNITITESYEGIEGLNIEIYGGNIVLTADDDGLNAAGGTDSSGMGGPRGDEQFAMAKPGEMQGEMSGGMPVENTGGSIKISGGKLVMKASGDGIDSNGTLDITGGYIEVSGPTNGDTAVLDYESSGKINGGTFVGTGAYMMAQSLESEAQGVLAVSVGSQTGGTTIEILDKSGNLVHSFAPELSYQIMIFSSPKIAKEETYTINVGSVSGEVEAN